MIDGIELIKFLTHEHDGFKGVFASPVADEERLVRFIDAILADHDKNGDGYIDFPEYRERQIRDSK
ncbi:hypothetical protein TELCIR_02586 [Teladorsagia circumcincta]|uniref:EF-hand domain-containing protein n=1 Tax=Teladorsagia circumcincta TaxID=45464 RepID=A0A2G9UZ10_TELCI|nr:hypothetical protein TELCIR_02586 [Teladorsagia circumcincta]